MGQQVGGAIPNAGDLFGEYRAVKPALGSGGGRLLEVAVLYPFAQAASSNPAPPKPARSRSRAA